MKNIIVEQFKQVPVTKQRIEIVERKGIGHPDTICDSIMNEICIILCEEYLKKVGVILHHNIDKALLVAGQIEPKFGGGKVTAPMLLIFGDRATYNVGDIEFPVKEIAVSTAKNWLKENIINLDPENHMKYQVELKPGSLAITDIFRRKDEILGAGDTSAAIGYAPFTPTESVVLNVEKFLNSKSFKKEFPESGEDIKVMGFRSNEDLHFTIGMAFVDKFVISEGQYFKRKEEIVERIKGFVSEKSRNDFKNVEIDLNTLDRKGREIEGLYLTVTGTSADSGDCGQVGRGNRANGVISLNRPASEEAAAGKNPVSHVGKIYNLLSFKIAKEIYDQVTGLEEVYVWLLSQIGRPINDPKIAATQVVLSEGTKLESMKRQIEEAVNKELDDINGFCKELVTGKIPVC